ncbi:hypothetical protein TMatcc_010052 [Talaromyces marneffei ATCC 18224]
MRHGPKTQFYEGADSRYPGAILIKISSSNLAFTKALTASYCLSSRLKRAAIAINVLKDLAARVAA